jgi:hypothetical protein
MRVTVANRIYWRCVRALRRSKSATTVFGHPGKAKAIDFVWRNRRVLFAAYQIAENKIAYCATIPWIGPITKHHLAKNLGINTVKPDVHIARLAQGEGVTPWELCSRLATATGYREATIDVILWRGCADGYIVSWQFVSEGWEAATEALRPAVVAMAPPADGFGDDEPPD